MTLGVGWSSLRFFSPRGTLVYTGVVGSSLLQISYSPSFVFNSLFIPFTQDCCQVFLDSHLFSVAAVTVCEYAIWVPFGKGFWVVLQAACPTARQRKKSNPWLVQHWDQQTASVETEAKYLGRARKKKKNVQNRNIWQSQTVNETGSD